MKKWSFIVAGLYGFVLLVLFVPLALIAFAPQWPKLSEIRETYMSPLLWAIIGVMIAAQFALLRIPVYVASRRPVTRGPLWTTIVAAAFMTGILLLGAAGSIYEFFTKRIPDGFWAPIVLGLASWIFWTIYFYRSTKSKSPDEKITHIRRHLWAGSILELLVAIPTHIVARHRDYCCAGMMTFLGLACGFSVMIFAFGPAAYFLFVERWRRLHSCSNEAK